MAIKEAINQFFYKLNLRNYKKIEIFENRIWVYLLYLFFLILAFFLYNKIINFEENKSSYQEKIGKLTESKEVSKINEILFTNLRKPYKEINYKIKNNDSIEKILNLFLIDPKEVNKIIDGLKSKKLTRLYAGREFKIIFKKNDIDSNSIVRINYPISNTLSVEVKRNRNEIIIEENADNALISLKLNQWLENKIRKNPSQWIWTHDRWK